jgi:hypothetical protein
MPLGPVHETFRSRETIEAAYFDGSIESALEVARLFPSRLQIEFTGPDGDFLLRAVSQAAFVPPRVWVYRLYGSGHVEWRDHEELTKKWEQLQGEVPKSAPKKGKAK